MSGALQGKRVLLTGCVANIGRATAALFAEQGARLVLVDFDPAGQSTADAISARGGEAHFTRADVSSPEDVLRAVDFAEKTLGGIDIIVNNAGVQHAGKVTEFGYEQWRQLLAVNPGSCFLMAKYGVPVLRRAGGGVIVNMASLAAVRGGPGLTGYAASKGAIVAFSKALAAELASESIRVNTICPGWVDTSFNDPAMGFLGGKQALDDAIAGSVPLGRQARPEEIANGILFLASDASSYMTGQALVIDGGVF